MRPNQMEREELLGVAVGFWPLPLTYALVSLTLYFHVAWVGAVVLTIALCLPRLWWSCVFGMPNWMTFVAGIAACAIVTIRGML
ncbi:hypothetical protein [Neorhodopirellula lusitana]|uniref:hypothetical protein n=1 Tax=Neorhodopirellula lusitana TaxID=445327 RepID=UPI0024B6D92E|nr:hypothetical protein [Neorhodopirellula lusitana]